MRRLSPTPDLDKVTLVSVTGVHVDAAQRAMQRSMARLRFGRALLISSHPPARPDPEIERIGIPPMTIHDYSRFMLDDLHRYIDTSHVLVVQADGFVINPERWDPGWLEFDYIGAPWPPLLWVGGHGLRLNNLVGNGGFSLRSRNLLQLTAAANASGIGFPASAEDMIICNVLYPHLTARGMRFAPAETAARFAIEQPGATFGQTLATSFGFHGHWNAGRARRWRPLRGTVSSPTPKR